MASLQSSYLLLGLKPGAERAEVKRAFRRLAMALHPDQNPGSTAQFQRVCEAYQQILDNIEQQHTGSAVAGDSITVPAALQSLGPSRERRRTSRGQPHNRRFELVQEHHYKGVSVSEKV